MGFPEFEKSCAKHLRVTVSEVFSMAIQGLRLYWPAVVAMQLAAGLSVLAYNLSASFRAFADHLAIWKTAGGLWFAALATIISGGVIPEILKAFLRPKGRRAPSPGEILHQFTYFGVTGILVERFYALQAMWLGNGREPWRLASKIFVDQFGYTLFIATPLLITWFAWRENGYGLTKTFRALTPKLIEARLPPLFIPNVIFWAPSLIFVYALPQPLQFILFIFLNAGWCILAIFIARSQISH